MSQQYEIFKNKNHHKRNFFSCYAMLVIIIFFVTPFNSLASNENSTPQIDSLISEGYVLLKIKETDKAIKLAENAFTLSNKNNYHHGLQNSLLLLARIYRSQNKFSQTLDYYLQLLSEINSENEETLKSLAYNEIGSLYFDSGLYEKALEYFLKSDTSDPRILDVGQKIKLLKNIAYSYEKVKNYNKALEYYLKVLPYYQEQTLKKQRGGVLVMLADICKKMNQYKDAATYELQNLDICKSLKDTSGIAVSLNNLGAIYKNLGENKVALKYFLESYELKRASGDINGIPITCLNIGIMYQLMEDYEESLKYLFKALEMQNKIGKDRDIAHTCNLIAAVYYYTKNYLKAESFSLEAIDHGQKAKATDLLETSYKLLSHIYKIQGNNNEALEYYQQYSDIKDSIALQQKIKQQELYLKYLDIENKEAQIKDLMIDKELKELEYKKLQLEKEKKDKDWELLKRDKDIQEISLRQRQLQQEKAINLLKLKEQQYRADASEQELTLLKQEQLLQDKEKQNKIESLKSNAEINHLKLSKREAELRMQKIWQIAIIVLFLITLLIIFLIFNRYKLKQKASQSKLTTKNLEIEQKFLRAQMNPHFMFNALNSIQSFVSLNDTYSAERYLAKFSRLMRYILDNTSQPYITIEKEIETLLLYLELEQLRFDNKFDFQIEVSPDIEVEQVVLPPMLTQPFVENAIIHGIVHKKQQGHISIKFTRKGDSIISTITDDGVGRDEAFRIKKKAGKAHKSMGMQVTRDRLALLNEIHGSNFSASISDLKDTDGNANGTRVDLKILYREI